MKKEIKVIKVNSDFEIVINCGSDDGIEETTQFLIYKLGEELFDPDTNESLGHLEILCGKGKVKHLQPKITTLYSINKESSVKTTIIKRTGGFLSLNTEEETKEPTIIEKPFHKVDTSCFARIIN
ncbi:MAG: hypothetical protein MJ225_03045 [Bacilli bacterium]|nr:hypothetical protein [Bacilli bacterium]